MEVTGIRTPGLGDSTYILVHEGQAILVDPQRDYDRFMDVIEEAGAELRFVLETHLHNDYVSGGWEIAKKTGAEIVVPAGAAPWYRSTPAFHMEEIKGEKFSISPIHTPGHTPEHTSYAVDIDGKTEALFSGGSLLVASAGRPDLLGLHRADTLARSQYISVHRLAEYPDETPLYPTHGEGSFCTVSGAGLTTSTIGTEKLSNPVLLYPTVDDFVDATLADLGPYPAFYKHMSPANADGFPAAPPSTIPEFSYSQIGDQVHLVDLRSQREFAKGHVPGSIGMRMGDQVGVWAGWLLPFDAEILLIADSAEQAEQANRQFIEIGMDGVMGWLNGVEEWVRSGGSLASYPTVSVDEFVAAHQAGEIPLVIDVRMPAVVQEGTLPGAVAEFVPSAVKHVSELVDGNEEVWLACNTGNTATISAKWFEEAGVTPTVLVDGGIRDVLAKL
jgi:hydroxyacylglutathione hydrolase